eukprot:1194377-Prorocentrum_minimum.AAC.6
MFGAVWLLTSIVPPLPAQTHLRSASVPSRMGRSSCDSPLCELRLADPNQEWYESDSKRPYTLRMLVKQHASVAAFTLLLGLSILFGRIRFQA